MSNEKLREVVNELLNDVDQNAHTRDQLIETFEKHVEALRAAHDALRPEEEPLTINGLTVEQRLQKLDQAPIDQAECLQAVADHFRELYEAYAGDTKAIYNEREAEVADLTRQLKGLHETKAEKDKCPDCGCVYCWPPQSIGCLTCSLLG